MWGWILFAISCVLNVVVILHARSNNIDAIAAIDEANATKQTYLRFLEKANMKFGEKKVGRVARDVLREVQDEFKAKGQGVV